MNLKKRMESSKCAWLGVFLKDKIKEGNLRTYNGVKKILYYFPSLLDGLTRDDFELALKHPDDTYICINSNDNRYKVYDELYKRKNGVEFTPCAYEDTRYITLNEVFEL